MRAFSIRWSARLGWSDPADGAVQSGVQLLLALGPVQAPDEAWFAEVAARWPHARLVYVTTGGQIDGVDVLDDEVVLTGLAFDSVKVRVHVSADTGVRPIESLARQLGHEISADPGVRDVLLFLDGLHLDGATFTAALTDTLPQHVTVSGGLASDGLAFVKTGIGVDGPPVERQIVAVTLGGASLAIGIGSADGWEPFGPERLISRAEVATVFELDDQRALDVYRRYLGDLAAELPGSALLFPLSLAPPDGGPSVVRTILAVNDEAGSMRFAGDMPQGHRVRLMRATNDSILDGAALAAKRAHASIAPASATLLFCVSCVGRRAVLKSRVGEEIDEVAYGSRGAIVTGYYGNGEISPPGDAHGGRALLHNQTMTITAIGEC